MTTRAGPVYLSPIGIGDVDGLDCTECGRIIGYHNYGDLFQDIRWVPFTIQLSPPSKSRWEGYYYHLLCEECNEQF